MRVVRKISELQIHSNSSIGFVPTMGALHDGHLQLMRRSKEETELSVISIFVNPLQFAPNEDYSRYPRPLENDLQLAESVGVDVVFVPEVSEIYPNSEPSTKICVPDVTDRWEGVHRPGHFDGVATVVAKLFHIVSPNIAFFGRKDFQQCMVIERMVRDLNIPVQISIEPTVREADGLAMSSRNRYLSPEERNVAPRIYQNLLKIRENICGGGNVENSLLDSRKALSESGIILDYLELVDNFSLAPLKQNSEGTSLIFAGKLGSTRLIDNIAVS